jgi:hypothetical protein
VLIAASLLVGLWACTRTAQHMAVADPGAIVWDEIVAFWIVLWVLTACRLLGPGGGLRAVPLLRRRQARAGALGRPAYKLQPGQAIGWRQGFGILFDDWWRPFARCSSSPCGCSGGTPEIRIAAGGRSGRPLRHAAGAWPAPKAAPAA